MLELILSITLLLNSKWEMLLDTPICIEADNTILYVKNECSLQVCNWDTERLVLVFLSCKNEQLKCNAFYRGKEASCSLYENEQKFMEIK